MTIKRNAMGSGTAPAQAVALVGGVSDNFAATGSTQATAALLPILSNVYVTSGAASSGVILPPGNGAGDSLSGGDFVRVFNYTGNTIIVYPPLGGKVANGTINAGISLANTNSIKLVCRDRLNYGASAGVGGFTSALKVVGFRGRQPISSATFTSNTTGRVQYTARDQIVLGGADCSTLALAFCNWTSNGATAVESTVGNTNTIKAALETFNGTDTTAPATFSAASSVTMTDGQAIAVTDEILPAALGISNFSGGMSLWARVDTQNILNQFRPGYAAGIFSPDTAVFNDGSVNQVNNIGALTGTASTNGLAPIIAVLGRTKIPQHAIGLVGDSIMNITNDGYNVFGNGGDGCYSRGLFLAGIPSIKLSQNGSTAQQYAASNTIRASYASLLDVLWTEHSVNDIPIPRTGAQIYANLQTIWAAFRAVNPNIIIVHSYCTYKTTWTGGGTPWTFGGPIVTEADYLNAQTPNTGFGSGGIIDDLDTLLNAGLGTGTGPSLLFNPRPTWFSGRSWSSSAGTTDGLHPGPAGHANQAPVVQTFAANTIPAATT